MAERRSLKFNNWDDVLADLHTLETSGYVGCGKWNLEQTCRHVNDWLRFPLDGFPVPPLPIRWMLAAMKHTVGTRQFRKIIQSGKMPAGAPTLNETVYTSSGDDLAALTELRKTIARFQAHEGSVHPSPLFGPMDKAACQQLQLVHFSHHLSFLSPRTNNS